MRQAIKPMLTLALCAALCLPMGACRAENGPEPITSIKLGVTVYDQYDTFIGEMMDNLLELAQIKEQETGISINIIREYAERSQEAQNTQVENLIEAGCDVLCVNLVDRLDVATILDKAQAAGLPVVFFNRELVEEDLKRGDRLFYVGADALESGRLQGEIVAEFCRRDMAQVDRNGDGIVQYVMLEGEKGHQDAIVRTEYSVKALMDAGYRVERLEDEIANWVRSQAETKMTQWLDAHGGAIEVVFANNDDMALGAVDALKRAGIPSGDWPVVVGIDGTSIGLAAVATGEMSGTVYNDARGQSEGLLELSYALATGGELPPLENGKYIRLPYRPVTAENVLEFMAPPNGAWG